MDLCLLKLEQLSSKLLFVSTFLIGIHHKDSASLYDLSHWSSNLFLRRKSCRQLSRFLFHLFNRENHHVPQPISSSRRLLRLQPVDVRSSPSINNIQLSTMEFNGTFQSAWLTWAHHEYSPRSSNDISGVENDTNRSLIHVSTRQTDETQAGINMIRIKIDRHI
jgi:hypothetical protein